MKLLDEFKAFALKGNVVDMAVGISYRWGIRENRVFIS